MQKFGKEVGHILCKDGRPDVSELVVPTPNGKKAQVEIAQMGDNGIDFPAADEASHVGGGSLVRNPEY